MVTLTYLQLNYYTISQIDGFLVAYLPLAGGTMTGTLSMMTQAITSAGGNIGTSTGVWDRAVVRTTKGGTGTNMTFSGAGSLLYSASATAMNELVAASNGNILQLAGGVPSWVTPGSVGVTTLAGTANQITASASTGAITLSIPSDFRAPGSLTVTTGQAAFGGALQSGVFTYIKPTTAYQYGLNVAGNIQAPNGDSAIVFAFNGTTTGPSSGSASIYCIYASQNIASGGGTIDNFYNLYLSSGAASGVAATNTYGAYIQRPNVGTNRLGAYIDCLYVGKALGSDGTVATGLLKTKNNTLDDGSAGAATFASTLGITGAVTLTVPLAATSGGTSLASFNAAGSMITSASTTTLQELKVGSAGQILKVVSSTPTWSGCPPQSTIYTTSSGNFTIPAGVTVMRITVLGAGGGGGGSTTGSNGVGGGAGGMLIKSFTGLTPGATCAYSVGAGGSGGAAGANNGSAGGDTSITVGGTTYTGSGGPGGINTAGVSLTSGGGNTGNGDINITGQQGRLYSTMAGGYITGAGGNTDYGTSTLAAITASGQTDGQNATGYGAGGSGAVAAVASSHAGGNGAGGLIIIEY